MAWHCCSCIMIPSDASLFYVFCPLAIPHVTLERSLFATRWIDHDYMYVTHVPSFADLFIIHTCTLLHITNQQRMPALVEVRWSPLLPSYVHARPMTCCIKMIYHLNQAKTDLHTESEYHNLCADDPLDPPPKDTPTRTTIQAENIEAAYTSLQPKSNRIQPKKEHLHRLGLRNKKGWLGRNFDAVENVRRGPNNMLWYINTHNAACHTRQLQISDKYRTAIFKLRNPNEEGNPEKHQHTNSTKLKQCPLCANQPDLTSQPPGTARHTHCLCTNADLCTARNLSYDANK